MNRIVVDDAELLRLFNQIPKWYHKNILRSIARSAAKPIVEEARNILSQNEDTGTSKRSIMIKGSRRYPGVYVGPNYKRGKADGRYTHNFSFKGTKTSPDNPIGNFMEEAAKRKKAEVEAGLRSGLIKVLARSGKFGFGDINVSY